jgi:hypothetical protein
MNDKEKPTVRLAIALTTVGKLADIARQDPDFLQVRAITIIDAPLIKIIDGLSLVRRAA